MFRIAVPCILLILSPVLTLTLKPSSVVRTFPNTSKRPILKPQIELNRRCVFQTILSSGVALGFGSSNANAFDAEQASRDIRKKINEAVTERYRNGLLLLNNFQVNVFLITVYVL